MQVDSVFLDVKIALCIKKLLAKVVTNAGIALSSHVDVLCVALIDDLNTTTDSCIQDKLEEMVTSADAITQALKDQVMKVVKNPQSQAFKKCYRVWYAVKDIPQRILADLAAQLPSKDGLNEARCEQVAQCGGSSNSTMLYALLAIAQNCFRTRKPGEVPAQLHEAARECQAVKDVGANIPPKFAAILASA